jgi:IS4 transposase
VPLSLVEQRPLGEAERAAAIEGEEVVELASQQRARLPFRLRRDDGTPLTILSNDLDRTAAEIAALYRTRWQIELLFRWIKQHLKIGSFLGRCENAIPLQIIAALIAYLLLRLAARDSRSALLALRFADLVRAQLFERRPLAAIGRPPPLPSSDRGLEHQLTLTYA